MTSAEVLQYAIANDIINVDDVLKDIMNKERQEIIQNHPYRIWQSKDGMFKTYVYDETRSHHRRQIARKSSEKLYDVIVSEYKKWERGEKEKFDIESLYHEWTEKALESNELVKGTVDRYNNDWDRFYAETEFVKSDIRTMGEMDIVRFLKGIVCSRAGNDKITRKCFGNIKTILIGIFCYAKTEREIKCIPIHQCLKDIKIPAKQFKQRVVKDSEQVFSDEEALMIADYIISNYRSTRDLGVLLALLTGLRVGELCTLKFTDQDGYKLYIQRTEVKEKDRDGKTVIKVREFPKTSSSMDAIELSESAYSVLELIKKINLKNGVTSDFLFWDNQLNQRIKSRAFDKKIRRICSAVEIPVRSMHKLRKTYASILLANGVEEKIAQKQMRHKDPSVTHKYYEFAIRSRGYMRQQLNSVDMFKTVIDHSPETQSTQSIIIYENQQKKTPKPA